MNYASYCRDCVLNKRCRYQDDYDVETCDNYKDEIYMLQSHAKEEE